MRNLDTVLREDFKGKTYDEVEADYSDLLKETAPESRGAVKVEIDEECTDFRCGCADYSDGAYDWHRFQDDEELYYPLDTLKRAESIVEDEAYENEQKLDAILEDLGRWLENSETDDSIRYAYENDYRLHAASLWLSSGAMSEELEKEVEGVFIDPIKEKEEIEDICKEAYIYICKSCNHHAFLETDEGDDITCISCGKLGVISE